MRLASYISSLPLKRKSIILHLVDSGVTLVALALTLMLEIVVKRAGALALGDMLVLAVAAISASVIASRLSGLDRIRLKFFGVYGIGRTGIYAALTTLGVYACDVLIGSPIRGGLVPLFGFFLFTGVVTLRFVMLESLYLIYRNAATLKPVAIFGAGLSGQRLAAELRRHDTVVPVAFIDEDRRLSGHVIGNLPVFSPADIDELIAEKRPTQVILAVPSMAPTKAALISRRLHKLGLDVKSVPLMMEVNTGADQPSVNRLVEPEQFLDRGRLENTFPRDFRDFDGVTVMVTGAGGSIGSELCRQLIALGAKKLVMFELSEFSLYRVGTDLEDFAASMGCELVSILGSVRDPDLLDATLFRHKPSVVFHAAAYKHVPLVEDNIVVGLQNNVLGTRALALACETAGVARFILVSSDKAVRPSNVMGASKRMAELIIQDLATRSLTTRYSMVRFGNVLGSSGSVVPRFQDQIARGGPITLTHDDVTRYFMTVTEAVSLVMMAAAYSKGGDVFVLDMGQPIRIRDLARQMIESEGLTVKDTDNPLGDIAIEVTGLRPGEKLHEELLIGEGRLTTPHPKIMRAQETYLSEIEMAAALKEMGAIIDARDPEAAREFLARWVDGYTGAKVKIRAANAPT